MLPKGRDPCALPKSATVLTTVRRITFIMTLQWDTMNEWMNKWRQGLKAWIATIRRRYCHCHCRRPMWQSSCFTVPSAAAAAAAAAKVQQPNNVRRRMKHIIMFVDGQPTTIMFSPEVCTGVSRCSVLYKLLISYRCVCLCPLSPVAELIMRHRFNERCRRYFARTCVNCVRVCLQTVYTTAFYSNSSRRNEDSARNQICRQLRNYYTSLVVLYIILGDVCVCKNGTLFLTSSSSSSYPTFDSLAITTKFK